MKALNWSSTKIEKARSIFFIDVLLVLCEKLNSRWVIKPCSDFYDIRYLDTAWKVSNTEFFWSVFSCVRTEYRKIQTRKNSLFGHFHVVWAWAWFLEYFSLFDDIEPRNSSKNTSYEKETFCKLYHNYKSLLKLLKINKLLVSSNWIVVEK